MSPPGDLGPEPHSDVHPVVKAEMQRAFRVNELFTAAVALLVGLGTLWVGQYVFLGQARAAGKEAADSGVSDTRNLAASTQRELERFEHEVSRRLGRVDEGQQRTDAKLDILLYRLNIANPAPAPKDGGQ